MTEFVAIVLFAWPAVVLLIFPAFGGRRAVLLCFLLSWLFLPVGSQRISGFLDYGKVQAASLGAFLGIVVFDRRILQGTRPRWIDLPILLWCTAPLMSSLTNGLGLYDGLSEVLGVTVTWGLPYVAGRLYLGTRNGLRDLALTIVAGGLIYVPLCLFEIRMSPVLHEWIYGYHQHSWIQTKRGGAWRPTVFMEHGLAVSMWMATATLTAFWIWISGAVDRFAGLKMRWWVILLAATSIQCRSLGAALLLGVGVAVLLACRQWRRGIPWLILILLPSLYVVVRVGGLWSGGEAVDALRRVSPERAESVDYRLRAENLLVDHALKQPLFGWGGWARNRPATFDAEAADYATDGLWIIVLGKNGALGLAGLLGVMFLPAFLLALKMPREGWAHPSSAFPLVLGVILSLYMLDCLLNAMHNPFYLLAAGGLAGAVEAALRDRRAEQAARVPGAVQVRPW